MIPKPFADISQADLDQLVTNQVKESRTLEYKSAMPGKGNSEVVPFLAEVSAFANTMGGDLLLGVSEDDGAASAVPGLQIDSIDQELLRLESLIRDGVEPRLQTVSLRAIDIAGDKHVILVRVKRSWNTPHRVIRNSTFYGRNSVGKYPLDVLEIRNAFSSSSHAADHIRSFRSDRVSRLLRKDELPVDLADGAILVLHMIPLSSVTSPIAIDVEALYRSPAPIAPLGASGRNHRVNLDGVLIFSGGHDSASRAYTQVFRSGRIEAVACFTPRAEGKQCVPSTWVEDKFIANVTANCKLLSELAIEPPIFVFLSLARARGYSLAVKQRYFFSDEAKALDRDVVEFPEVMIQEYDQSYALVMKPVFDMLWNAFGFPKSVNFDSDGNWVGNRT